MNVDTYKKTLIKQFIQYFESVKAGKPDDALKLRIQGFIQAGEVIAIIDKHDANEIMEHTHFDVFALTIEQRKHKKEAFKQALKTRDDSYFQVPAYERC